MDDRRRGNINMFIDRLIESIKEKNNPTVVGLDPNLESIPAHIRENAFRRHGRSLKAAGEAILEFNRKIIDAVCDIAPVVKPQLAYYEMYGIEGMKAFMETVRYAKSKGLLVIADGKRNDIGSTAEAYSHAYLGRTSLCDGYFEDVFGVDALTVNPMLGYDGIRPFLDDCRDFGKGIFILVKTSNKSSGQVQDIVTNLDASIYEILANHVNEWGKGLEGKYGYSAVGAVVGATYPNQAKKIRSIMRNAYILVPGFGAQGGTAKDVVHSFGSDGRGALVNASRSIIYAYRSEEWRKHNGEESFDTAAREAAIKMRDEINKAIKQNREVV